LLPVTEVIALPSRAITRSSRLVSAEAVTSSFSSIVVLIVDTAVSRSETSVLSSAIAVV
jgi:hypothetical protein